MEIELEEKNIYAYWKHCQFSVFSLSIFTKAQSMLLLGRGVKGL